MILRQYLHTDLVIAASYLFGCGSHAAGAAVDPVGEPEHYLDAAAAVGLRLRYVIDTHVHADHVSSGLALAAAAGAEYVLHASAGARFPFRAAGTIPDSPRRYSMESRVRAAPFQPPGVSHAMHARCRPHL